MTELEKISNMIYDACYDHLTENGIRQELPKIMNAIAHNLRTYKEEILAGVPEKLEYPPRQPNNARNYTASGYNQAIDNMLEHIRSVSGRWGL